MTRDEAMLILKAAGATKLQAEQFVGLKPEISAKTVAGAVWVLKQKEQSNG